MTTDAANQVDAGRSFRRNCFLWLAALVLLLPATTPYWTHYLYPPREGDRPTGFIQTDMPYYMANAREHFANGRFHLTYGLPYSPDYDTPKIYFQPHTLLLGLCWHFTRWAPQVVFLIFGFISGWVAIRIALAIFARLFGLSSPAQWLASVIWIWGGGVLVLVGCVRYFNPFTPRHTLDDLFFLDPFGGMWFLNLGRNFIYPTEAYYHALFLGMVYCLLVKRHGWAAVLLLVVSMSHPFTGVEAILIVLNWAVLERWWIGNREISNRWIGVLSLIFLGHLTYYLGILNWLSPEHRSLQEQWTLDWTYEAKHFVPAYLLVGLLTLWTLRSPVLAGSYLARPIHRFFLVWFLVAFALANHEFAFKPPMQPLHFTRGYVWMPLFLMGAEPLVQLLTRLGSSLSLPARLLGITTVLALFLSDNIVFLATFHGRSETSMYEVYLSDGYYKVVNFLNQPENEGALLISPDWAFNYYALLHTPLRAWFSHLANTPEFERHRREVAEFYLHGKLQPAWSSRTLLVVYQKSLRTVQREELAKFLPPGNALPLLKDNPLEMPAEIRAHGGRQVYADETFQVYRIDPKMDP